jgi:hypothetical protein
MVRKEFLGTEGSPLQLVNKDNEHHQSSVNTSPYAVLTAQVSENGGQFQSSTKKGRKPPKKNLISSI